MRVAAVDLGTNSTRLLVVDGGAAIVRRAVVTRLGEGVDATRRLSDAGMGRVYTVLEQFLSEIGEARTLAVGTSAVRDAANGAEFMREVAERFRFETRIVSGGEEAALTQLGVGATDPRTLILDVGGGSTELVAGDFHTSLEVGSVRLTERHLRSDPPTPAELDAAAMEVRALLPELEVERMIGVAGTVAQLRDLVGDLTLAEIAAELDRLAALAVGERRHVPRLDPERAPAIVAGALIVREALRRYGLNRLEYSERDLLDGVAGILAGASSFPVVA